MITRAALDLVLRPAIGQHSIVAAMLGTGMGDVVGMAGVYGVPEQPQTTMWWLADRVAAAERWTPPGDSVQVPLINDDPAPEQPHAYARRLECGLVFALLFIDRRLLPVVRAEAADLAAKLEALLSRGPD